MTETNDNKPRNKLNGAIVFGIVWMLLSGTCTSLVAVPSLFSPYGQTFGLLGLAVGAISFGTGLAVWLKGRAAQTRRG